MIIHNGPVNDKLKEDLSALGQSCDDIANSLKKRGIKGYLFKAGYCPIANYLHVKGYNNVTAFDEIIVDAGNVTAQINTPRAVRRIKVQW